MSILANHCLFNKGVSELDFSYERHIEHRFDAFCKKVLKNEAINIQRKAKKERSQLVSLSYLTEDEMAVVSYLDEYDLESDIFPVLKYKIRVNDELLARAIKKISKTRQAIVLLSSLK